MTFIGFILASLLGLFGRLKFGNAPHHPDPNDPTRDIANDGKPVWYAFLFFLGLVVAVHGDVAHWQPWVAAVLVSIVLTAGWNPGQGSWLRPGNGSKDDENIFNRIVPLVAFGQPPGSVWYCCAGMGIRYGLVTVLAAGAMWAANTWLGTTYSLGYAPVGFLATPVMLLLVALHWERWNLKPWIDARYHNGPFEAAIGALIYGGLALAS